MCAQQTIITQPSLSVCNSLTAVFWIHTTYTMLFCICICSPSNFKICPYDRDTLTVMLRGDMTFHSPDTFSICYNNISILLLGGF